MWQEVKNFFCRHMAQARLCLETYSPCNFLKMNINIQPLCDDSRDLTLSVGWWCSVENCGFSFKSCQWWSQPDSYRSNAEDRRETRERELHIPPGLWISQYHQERVIRWCGCEASLPKVLLSGPHEVGNNPVWSWPALFSTGSHALACCGDPNVGALWIFQLNSLPVSYLDRERHSCSMITQPWHFDDSEIQQLQFQATKIPIPGWNQLQAGFVW